MVRYYVQGVSIKMAVSPSDKICKEICDMIGLKHARKLNIYMETGKPITAEAEFYPEIDGVRQIVPVLRKLQLIPMSEDVELDKSMIGDCAADTTALGDKHEHLNFISKGKKLDKEYGLNGPNDKKVLSPSNFINERDI